MFNNYTLIHLHTMLSNPTTVMDSITSYKQYIDRAKECGMKAIAFTEHGNLYEWLHKKEYCEKNDLKYIHGVEAYVTETLDEKIRDNYHVVLLAKNKQGFEEINYLMSHQIAFNKNDGHKYYNPRITYDELKNTSDNVIITSACLGGILGKGDNSLRLDFIKFMSKNKHRCFLEIQHHNVDHQIKFNKNLYKIHLNTGIPLVVGTDTHALNEEHVDGRKVLQKSKNTHFDDEDGWDLSFKTYEELIKSFEVQNSMPKEVYLEAIKNTNIISDMVEEFEIDRCHKYPRIYNNSENVFKEKIKEYVKNRNIKLTKAKAERIKHEFKTYKSNGAIDYMLLEEDIKSWCRRNDINYGYSRGSVSGSYIAYLLKITDVDSLKYKLNFERFMSPSRKSLADIDTDYPPSKRDLVRQYISSKENLYCAEIITFNTIAEKGAIRDVGRAFEMPLNEVDYISKNIEDERDFLRGKYQELFKYVDLLYGVITSVGSHPCGFLVSPHPIEKEVSTFTSNTSNYPITQLNMKELDSLNYVKLDILGLDNIEIINEVCKLAKIERLTPDNTDYKDWNVWKSIRDDSLGVFQWEGDYAHSYFKQLFSDSTIKKILEKNPNMSMIDLMSIGNGAIRPAGESYREDLANGIFKDNGHKALNEFLSSTMGYLVFQEQVISFLNQFCGYSLGDADLVRRGFAKKTGTEEHIPRIKNGFIKTMTNKYGETKEKAEDLIVDFLKVIEDASRYLFSINHSDPYSRIGYACAWLRYYYPIEFLTVLLNINKDSMDKTNKVMDYMKKQTNIKQEPIKFRYSKANYSYNKDTNSIYKGIASLKYLNEKVSEELYLLRNNTYKTFCELLIDIKDKTSIDSRQLKILIILGFFSEFGKSKKLLMTTEYFDNIYYRKQIKKSDIESLNLPFDLVRNNSNKETDKLFKEIDTYKIVKFLESSIENKPLSLKDRLESEIEYLGYIDFTYSKAPSSLYYVIEFKTYKSNTKPYVDLYNIKTGEIIKAKITNENIYIEQPFKNRTLINILKMSKKPKSKLVDGKWIKSNTEFNNIIDEYEIY